MLECLFLGKSVLYIKNKDITLHPFAMSYTENLTNLKIPHLALHWQSVKLRKERSFLASSYFVCSSPNIHIVFYQRTFSFHLLFIHHFFSKPQSPDRYHLTSLPPCQSIVVTLCLCYSFNWNVKTICSVAHFICKLCSCTSPSIPFTNNIYVKQRDL